MQQGLVVPDNPMFVITLILLLLWVIPWKGLALWRAAKNNDLAWFVILLIFQTLGILDIVYFFFFSKRKKQPTSEQAQKLDVPNFPNLTII